MTAPGTVLGTLNYMAPEQVKGEKVDGRADIFAVERCSTSSSARSRHSQERTYRTWRSRFSTRRHARSLIPGPGSTHESSSHRSRSRRIGPPLSERVTDAARARSPSAPPLPPKPPYAQARPHLITASQSCCRTSHAAAAAPARNTGRRPRQTSNRASPLRTRRSAGGSTQRTRPLPTGPRRPGRGAGRGSICTHSGQARRTADPGAALGSASPDGRGAFAMALQILEGVTMLAPQHFEVATLREQVPLSKSVLAKWPWEPASAVPGAAFARGDPEGAIREAERLLGLNPANEDARALKEEAEAAVLKARQDAWLRAAIETAQPAIRQGRSRARPPETGGARAGNTPASRCGARRDAPRLGGH